MTSCASSYTAPSTQPPLTLPTTSPPAETAIAAPGGRGALRKVFTTVASPNVPPSRYQVTMSSSTSRTADSFHLAVHRAGSWSRSPSRSLRGRPRPSAFHSALSSVHRSDHRGQFVEGGEAVAGDEVIDIGKGGGHTCGQRLITGAGLVRVGPHDAMGEPMQV